MSDVKTKYHYDHENDRLYIERVQDVEPYLEHLAKIRQVSDGVSKSGDLRYAGTIPDVIVEKYCNEQRITYEEFIKNPEHHRRILNNPDFSKLRVWRGKL